ncbi:MAG: heterodisulfide reductase-related iron-sulfur binding cluster [Desulfomonilia bacterium]
MLKLKFEKDVCLRCETVDCLTKCRYLGLDLDQAKIERDRLVAGEKSKVLEDCVTCYACEEYCPYDNHPFYLIVELQERHGIHPVPPEIEEHQVSSLAPKGKIQFREMHAPLIDMCTFPMLKDSIKGPLFENSSIFWGTDVFCNLMYLHFGRTSVIKERLPKIVDNIWNYSMKPNNLDELICYHDECYATFTSFANAYGLDLPFTPIHLFDFILDRLTDLKDRIRPLNIRAAYHRNCSNRLIPETHARVDEIFDLIGVERVKREFEDENTLCCALSFDAQQRRELAENTRSMILEDLKASGAEYCVYNCPMCLFTLQDRVRAIGITPILMPDLCQMALGQ